MPSHDSCCAFGCTNRRNKPECRARGIRFFGFPKKADIRQEWVRRISRENLRPSDVTKNTKLCSEHFPDGKPTAAQPYPCYFSHRNYSRHNPRSPRRKTATVVKKPAAVAATESPVNAQQGMAETEDSNEESVGSAVPMQKDQETNVELLRQRVLELEKENSELKEQLAKLHDEFADFKRNSTINTHSCKQWSDKKFAAFSGLPSYRDFGSLCELFEPDMSRIVLSHGSKPYHLASGVRKRSGSPRDHYYSSLLSFARMSLLLCCCSSLIVFLRKVQSQSSLKHGCH